jgi:drug/metabolite transporter (DMT)-like permease
VRPAQRSAPNAAAAYAALAVTSLLWSGNTITGRALHDAIPPAAFAFWRWVLILALLAPFVAGELARQWPVIRRSWRILAALGLMSTALYHALLFWALHYTAAINAQLLNSTIPLWVLLMAWLALGARPTRREWLGLAVSGVGVAAILARGEWQRLAALEFNAGDLLMLAGMLVWSVYTLCLPRRPLALSAFAYTFVAGAFGLAGIAPIYAWELATGRGEFAVTGAVVAGILYTALLASIVATATFNFGVDGAGAARASFFTHLVPVFGAVLGVLLLGEPVGWYHLAGFALILAGIAIATRVPWRLGSARGAG